MRTIATYSFTVGDRRNGSSSCPRTYPGQPGLAYPALQRLERQGAITADWGFSETNGAPFYRLTRRVSGGSSRSVPMGTALGRDLPRHAYRVTRQGRSRVRIVHQIVALFRALFRAVGSAELDEEIAFTSSARRPRTSRMGCADAAYRAARPEFGSVDAMQEQSRDERRPPACASFSATSASARVCSPRHGIGVLPSRS